MTKKNRGLIIALIILLCLIAAALIGIMAILISGNTGVLNRLPLHVQREMYYDQAFESDGITNIEIASDAGDITVKPSDGNKVRVVANGNNKELFNVEQNDTKLIITSKSKPGNTSVRNLSGADIDIYIPQTINILTISNKFGDVDVLSKFDGKLKIENDCGNAKADVLLGSFDIHCDLGDVKIGRIDINADSFASTDMGDVEIESTNRVNIIAQTSLGDCDVSGNDSLSPITLKVHSDLGDVEVN